MTKLIIALFLAALPAFGQCGTITLNPLTQKLDCIGTGVPANGKIRSIAVIFDGQGSALVAGGIKYVPVPFACTIAAWTITVDTGTVTVDVKKIAAGTALPTASITASATPAIASNNVLRSTTLTGWTTAVSANDILGVLLSASASATNVSFMLECNTP